MAINVTKKTLDWVVAHEPNTDILHDGEMKIIEDISLHPPDDKDLEWQDCGKTYEKCLFVAGLTGRKCTLDFYIHKDGVLQPISFRGKEAYVACGQRPAAKER